MRQRNILRIGTKPVIIEKKQTTAKYQNWQTGRCFRCVVPLAAQLTKNSFKIKSAPEISGALFGFIT
jgi:hypothetical protein